MTAIDDVAQRRAERADALTLRLARRRILIDSYRRTTRADGKTGGDARSEDAD